MSQAEELPELEMGDPELNRITQAVIGACIEVHRILGPGYLESVYQKALVIEFAKRGIVALAQHPVALFYKGESVRKGRSTCLRRGV